ncbi:MAG: hypothetical protein IJS56_05635 [Bacilli bacterium]|nr:hypothetical protein [Bacilli bacterium]
MNILFLISTIFLIVTFIIIKKNNSKENIIKWIFLSIIFFFCFNTIIVFLLSIFNIVAYMWLRSIIFFGLGIYFLYLIIKKKMLQMYYFKVSDLIALIGIVACVFFIAVNRFRDGGFYFETTDPAAHFAMAQRFYKQPTLTMDMKNELFYHNKAFDLFFSYTSLGTVFEYLGNNSSVFNAYVFIIFELFVLGFSSYLFYLTFNKEKTKIVSKFFTLILAIVYMFSFPLNNLIFGFHYLGLSILIINSIIILFENYFSVKNPNKMFYYIILGIANFNVFTSYYLFVPIVYGGEGLYLSVKWLFKKEIAFNEALFHLLYTLVSPFIIGMIIFFVYPRFIPSNGPNINPFMLEGYIYRNLIGDFLVFIPFVIYALINNIRKKELDLVTFSFPFMLVFLLGLFCWIFFGDAGTYYFYKMYYLLALLIYLTIGKELHNSFNIYHIFTLFIVVLLFFYGIDFEGKVSGRNFLLNPINSISTIESIQNHNKTIVKVRDPIYSKKEMKSLENIFKVLKENNVVSGDIIYYNELLQKLWFYSLSEISPVYNYDILGDYYEDNKNINDVINENRIKFILVRNDYELKSLLDKKCNISYQDDNYILYQKKRD